MGIARLMLGNSFRCKKHPQVSHITIAAEPVITSPIYKAKVHDAAAYIMIDGRSTGVTYAELRSAITVSAYNCTSTSITFTRSDEELVCTGDTITIEARNNTASSSILYTIVVLGDVNCDGVVISDDESPDSDNVLLAEALFGNIELTTLDQVLAGNLHEPGKLEITIKDCQLIALKVEKLEEYLQHLITGVTSCEHEGGTATCAALAVCTKCGESYGEFADHVYPTVTSNNIQWIGSSGTCCDSARLVVNCSVCGGATISEYGSLSHNYHEDTSNGTECYGDEDCEATFENEVFKAVNPASCPYWHNKVHQGYRETDSTIPRNCQDQRIAKMTCQCGEESYDRYTGEYGPHNSQLISSTTGIDCKTAGLDTYECSICHAKESEDNTNYGPHNWVHQYDEDGEDCKTAGYKYYLCDLCGNDSYTNNGPMGPHSYGDWKPISGVNQHKRTCTICSDEVTGSCSMDESSVSYMMKTTVPNEHWINGTCKQCGRHMQESGNCYYDISSSCICGRRIST